MAINSAERAQIIEEITLLDTQILALNTAYTASLTGSATESYSLDTGQGRQSLKRRDPKTLANAIRDLKIQRKRLIQELNGSINVNLRMKRDGE